VSAHADLESAAAAPPAPAAGASLPADRHDAPPLPETLDDTGLTPGFVADLLLRTLLARGASTGEQLARVVRLPFTVIDEVLVPLQQRRFVEVRGAANNSRTTYVFELTGAGAERAQTSSATTHYVGPAPVTLATYRAWVARQSIHDVHVTRDAIRSGFTKLVLSDAFVDLLGPAINSARSLFLYGEAGNGKTLIAETIAQLMGGTVFVPHAVLVDGQVMLLYDPIHHRMPDAPELVQPAEGGLAIWRSDAATFDERFVEVQRPVVVTGGELSFEQLEMRYEPHARLYQAPAQVKANGGVLILDDFGRQRVPARDLLNRWMIPLEQRVDYLALHTGSKFPMPFDCLLVFATNLDPAELVEEAFLRRIRYKIHVQNPTREQFAEIFRRCCVERNIPWESRAVEFLFRRYYDPLGIQPRACHPRDIAEHICDVARYHDEERVLTPMMLERACESYFLAGPGLDGRRNGHNGQSYPDAADATAPAEDR
jgi:hypothetical protein